MHISILTPDREIFSGEITAVKVPGASGEFEVLKNHAPIVSALGKGLVLVKKSDGEELTFSIRKGFIEVLYNQVSLLVQEVTEKEKA
jgi:F-type H+-transporting ATPase subunit epsilon